MKVPFIDFIENMSQVPFKCLSERILRINLIVSRIPCWISKNIFVLGSYEFLAMLEDKIRKGPFLRLQSGKITVCIQYIICVRCTLCNMKKITFSKNVTVAHYSICQKASSPF